MSNDYFKVRTDGNIVDLEGKVIDHINLKYVKRISEKPQYEKICKNCLYYENHFGYGQCYGAKDQPRVDDNEFCKSWKMR